MGNGEFKAGEPCDGLTSHPGDGGGDGGGGGGARFALFYRNRRDGPRGSYADITINDLRTESPKGAFTIETSQN